MTTLSKHSRPATLEDAEYLAPRLRPEDLKELSSLAPDRSPLEALATGLSLSKPYAVVVTDDKTGKPYAIGGVTPVSSLPLDPSSSSPSPSAGGGVFGSLDGIGVIWALATPDIERHALTFQKTVKGIISRLFEEEGYTALCNVVSADNEKSVEWLRSLGFVFVHMNQPIGRNGELFHAFAMRRPDHV